MAQMARGALPMAEIIANLGFPTYPLTLRITRLRVGTTNSIFDNLAGKTRLKIAAVASRVNAVVGRPVTLNVTVM